MAAIATMPRSSAPCEGVTGGFMLPGVVNVSAVQRGRYRRTASADFSSTALTLLPPGDEVVDCQALGIEIALAAVAAQFCH